MSGYSQENLRAIARDITLQAAFDMAGTENYLPKTHQELAEFNPHQWVLVAVQRAYEEGVSNTKLSIRNRVKEALGLL